MITGKTLIDWGFKPDSWFKEGLNKANAMRNNGVSDDVIFVELQKLVPQKIEYRNQGIDYRVFIEAENDEEQENINSVHSSMMTLMRTPTVKHGAIMPDACPAGTIPVGAIVATEDAIHPGFHSADICCSMAITVFKRNDDPKKILDLLQDVVHFGPTYREKHFARPSDELMSKIEENSITNNFAAIAVGQFTTQGDGNHFYYVGHLESTGQLAIVSHHGSRGFGAAIYKRGMSLAKRHTSIVANRVPAGSSWLKASSQEGEDYWNALQLARLWTKENHFAVHDFIAKKTGNRIEDRFWNEHNFVFQKTDGLFYHAKGATPSYKGFSPDDDGRTIIPMNMREPILISGHAGNKEALEFAPHGAGRNMSRSKFLNMYTPEIPNDIDVRFYCGIPDKSELPDAYKNAETVQAQIAKFKLANIIDKVIPYGSIMAGDWESNAPWRNKKV